MTIYNIFTENIFPNWNVNEKDVIGSGKYEYDQIGLPFLRDLSKTIYNYERKRPKKHQPKLDEFDLFGDR